MTPSITPLNAQDPSTQAADSARPRADRAPDDAAFDGVFRSLLQGRSTSLAQQLPDRAPQRAVSLSDRARARQDGPGETATDSMMTGTPSLASVARAELASPAAAAANPNPPPASAPPRGQAQEGSGQGAWQAPTPALRTPIRASETAVSDTPSNATSAAASAADQSASRVATKGGEQPQVVREPVGRSLNASAAPPASIDTSANAGGPSGFTSSSGDENPSHEPPPQGDSSAAARVVSIADKAFPAARAGSGVGEATGTPPSLKHEAEQAFGAQLQRGLAAALNQNGGTVHIRLQPEALGDLKIRMDLKHGQVSAEFRVDSLETKTLLDRQLGTLREALETRGLEVGTLAVRVADPSERRASATETRKDSGPSPNQDRASPGTPIAMSIDANARHGSGGGWQPQHEDGSGVFRGGTGTSEDASGTLATAPSPADAGIIGSRSDLETTDGVRNAGPLMLRLDAIA
jgi:flagellar hook-length control protein FliK